MFDSLLFSSKGYAPLNHNENLDKDVSKSFGVVLARLLKWFVSILALSGAGGFGFLAGRRSINEQGAFQLGSFSRVFVYNGTYAEDSKESNAAWKELIPSHGGFFNHPTLAPQRSLFSVFHQLHCLNGMRQGYWAVYQAMNEQTVLDDDDMPLMSSPQHFQHCIDLLRQALMCQPDLTLELKNESIGGVEGFGTEHQCKDWNQLMSFTKKWETWGLSRAS
ncbi:hypothetical protein B0O99DRAFT_747329 [Bisporella sp. PMI_857]|nr:hypothetical protein B0O99DRAFT_747329 [Bisporella sp. PMI_857]